MLRYYQEEALDAILKNYVEGVTQQLLVMCTGSGKTVVFSNLYEKVKHILPKKMLVIAHREELLQQAVDKIKTWNPSLKVGLEKAEHKADADCDVVVACIASIGRKGSERMERFGWENFDKIIVDETHHILGSTYMKILEDAGVLLPENKKLLLGVTATPKRRNLTRAERKEVTTLDNEDIISLKSVFKKIVYTYPIRKAIKDKFLVPLVGYKVSTQVNLDDVKTTAGDFKQDELSEAVNTNDRNLLIVKAWQEYAAGKQTVVFTVDIKHAREVAEAYTRAGIKALPIWGDDPDRESKLRKHEAGEITVLCNCALLTEGYDSPTVECIVLARPTKSSSLMTQQVGRGTRLHPGKESCIVIDMVDNHKRCSLVTFPSLLGLNPEFNLRGESVTKAVEEVEAIQEKNPNIDFTHLTDLSKVKAYVESLDLFAEPYSEDVKEHSLFSWMSRADGSYMLAIPESQEVQKQKQYWNYKHEKLILSQNELEEWAISREAAGEATRQLGIFNTLKEAFETADDVIRRCRPDRVKLLQRSAGWHDATASDASKKYLKKLVGKKPFIYCVCPVGAKCSGVAGTICVTCNKQQLTAGQAALAINKFKVKS